MNTTHSQSSQITRRAALKTLGATAALASLGAFSTQTFAATANPPVPTDLPPFKLPPLGYAFDALEPHFDAQTMQIHHGKHHQAYITNANKALETAPETVRSLDAESLIRRLAEIPEPLRTTLRNNVGGHLNHSFFWRSLAPATGAAPEGPLVDAITKTFGNFDAFKTQFTDAAMKRFGSGWAWLVVVDGQLKIKSTANQDSPLMDGESPLLGLDVWEHAYYLKYQNRRADYVVAYWNLVSWKTANAAYQFAQLDKQKT